MSNDYTGCIKKLNKFEIALNVAKQLKVWSKPVAGCQFLGGTTEKFSKG